LGPNDLTAFGKEVYEGNARLIVKDFRVEYMKFALYDTVVFFDEKRKYVQVIKDRGVNAYYDFPHLVYDPRYTINE